MTIGAIFLLALFIVVLYYTIPYIIALALGALLYSLLLFPITIPIALWALGLMSGKGCLAIIGFIAFFAIGGILGGLADQKKVEEKKEQAHATAS